MTDFYMKPNEVETRLRSDHNTLGAVISSWQPSDLVKCSEEWTAPADLFKPDGMRYQKAGDRWGRVVKINDMGIVNTAWMAIVNQGLSICTIVDAPPPPGPESPFVAAVLIRQDGSKVNFDLVKKE